ncbi:MAG: lysophospholipid acyltransferase family protein [Chryseolinea sp.]
MKILRAVYTAYGVLVFTLLFFLSLPFFLIPMTFKSQHRMIGIINRWWARLLFIFIAIPFKVEYRRVLDKRKTYIFCSNHFSYLDIPASALVSHNAIFVGKTGIEVIPLFGYVYGKLHITVDRKKLKSRYESIKRSMQAIAEGKNLIIFPEGGMAAHKEPVIGKFKDGAFRIAIEKQIAIVPVTIPFNWIILPADEFLLRWHPLKVIFHEPLETKGLTMADIDSLKQTLFSVLDNEMKSQLKNEN